MRQRNHRMQRAVGVLSAMAAQIPPHGAMGAHASAIRPCAAVVDRQDPGPGSDAPFGRDSIQPVLSVWLAQCGNQLIEGSQQLPHLKRAAGQEHGILKGWRSHQAAQGRAICQLEKHIGMARKAERAGAGQITATQGVKLGAAPNRV
jgi:hypothetical protein